MCACMFVLIKFTDYASPIIFLIVIFYLASPSRSPYHDHELNAQLPSTMNLHRLSSSFALSIPFSLLTQSKDRVRWLLTFPIVALQISCAATVCCKWSWRRLKQRPCTLVCLQGAAIRNRLAVRIAGSHPVDRGSIPRYGRRDMVFSHNMAD